MEMARTNQGRMESFCMNNARLMELPTEILDDIHLRLPISCLFCLRCVCKTSKDIVDCPCFGTLHMRRLLSVQATGCSDQVPLLMLLDHLYASGYAFTPLKYDGNNGTLTRSDEHATVSQIRPTSMKTFFSLGFVYNNLFFFLDRAYIFPQRKKDRSPCFLFNPLKGEVLPLSTTGILIPDCHYSRSMTKEWFGMGFDDVMNTYKIVRVSGHEFIGNLMAQVHVLGTNSWREIPSVPPSNLSKNHAFVYGDQHWFFWLPNHSIGSHTVLSICSFNFKREEFYWTIPPPEHMQSQYTRSRALVVSECLHLLNLKGSLAIVDTLSDDCIEIWVLKNYVRKEWRLEYKIDSAVARGKLTNVTCCEWEYGIFFSSQECSEDHRITVFMDLRNGSINHVKLFPPRTTFEVTSILSYVGTLISLKNYGNLIELKPTTGRIINV